MALTILTAPLIVLIGTVVGVLAALFGVGGGLIMVPFIVFGLGETQHLAEGTSLLVIVPTAVVGVLVHRKRGYVSFRHVPWLALGGVAGGFAGARLALTLSEQRLQIAFGSFLLIMGAGTIFQGWRSMRSEKEVREREAEWPQP